ncbi:helix-turn-helix transcriptional regulator [Natronoarchaeum rubrum]|uniref:helix-turn-helix transcriptional regulator n=1 Tax=Natronoarchaeum rubrum TaxID=755311 RepID=UPI002112B9D4|nr:helix-turn-helix domain-containing protein [Natronoarchaeum rubrum]
MNGSLGVGLATGIFLVAALFAGVPAVDAGPIDRTAPQDAAPTLDSASVAQTDAPGGFSQQSEETEQFDSVAFRITVHENGTAVWTFSYERRLANESEREQFESFAEEFRTNESHPLYEGFRSQATSLVDAGASATDREMNASTFRKDARIREERLNRPGVVTMSFHWSNFAQEDGERLIVGDVFEGGLYVGEDQSIVFERGEGVAFDEASPTDGRTLSNDSLATSDTVTWVGPREFTDKKPRAELAPRDAVGPTDDTATKPASGDSDPWMMIAGVVVLLLGVGSAVAWRRDGGVIAGTNSGTTTDGAAADPTPATDDGPDEPDDGVPEEELLTDEDRVTSLLEENGGRMKQVNIVEETGWSKSKVSMLLSDMEEEGQISKLRVGRENIISLDGHEPEAAGSPFENDE